MKNNPFKGLRFWVIADDVGHAVFRTRELARQVKKINEKWGKKIKIYRWDQNGLTAVG